MADKQKGINDLARGIVDLIQRDLARAGVRPVIHFELEGCYRSADDCELDYDRINRDLRQAGIKGNLKPEYWRRQWEYVSDFSGQSPLEEADFLQFVLDNIDRLFRKQGIPEVMITPVLWRGDRGKYTPGSKRFFSPDTRDVHIPNAVQLNVSVHDKNGRNLVAEPDFGDRLQQAFLETSLECCLLYLPEEQAFERLKLKSAYGLADELCSPLDISGGHQGSVALYRERGKHNQPMGEETLILGADQRPLLSSFNWQKTARVEHRLGASSRAYNPYLNIIYALLNISDTVAFQTLGVSCAGAGEFTSRALPGSLIDTSDGFGAVTLFQQSDWFAASINRIVDQFPPAERPTLPEDPGNKLKQQVLSCYQPNILMNR